MVFEDQQTYPEYINVELFRKALQNGLGTKDICITDMQLSMGSASGDNYCSDIYRAFVTYTQADIEATVSLIVKAIPYTNEARAAVLEEMQVYEKELTMYFETVPKMSALMGGEFFSAKCYYATTEPVQLIVFEDLKALGYIMTDRQNGLDEKHCELVMSKLGKFHAASMILAELDENAMQHFSYGFIKPNFTVGGFVNFVSAILKSFVGVIQQWPGFEKIHDKLKAISENSSPILEHIMCNTPATIKVLNHGDLWKNNIMFKYDNVSGNPVDVVFLDLQVSMYTSPGHDISYFLHTSPTSEVREHHHDRNVSVYYESFKASLLDLKHDKVPTFDAILSEIRSREFNGLIGAITCLPLILQDKESAAKADMSLLSGEDEASLEFRRELLGNDAIRLAMQPILRRWDALDVFDDFKITQ